MFGDCSKVSSTSWRRNWRREAEASAATRVVSSRTCPTILTGTGSNAPAPEKAHEPRLTMAGVAEGWTEQSELALEDLVVEVLVAELKGDDKRQPILPGANLGAFGDDELRSLGGLLRSAETSVSIRRRTLHDHIDQLQSAIVERYKVGAADADTLLK